MKKVKHLLGQFPLRLYSPIPEEDAPKTARYPIPTKDAKKVWKKLAEKRNDQRY